MEENMSEEIPQPNSEQLKTLKNPDFNAGNFVMYLASDPRGFEIVTDNSLPRKDSPLPLNKDERKTLEGVMASELKFTGGFAAKDALDAVRNAPSGTNTTELKNVYEEKRKQYVESGNKPKVGVRNIRRTGAKLIVDIKPVSFPVYKNFSTPDASNEKRNFSENAATCMSIVTVDNKLLVQHRGEGNELFGDMPGASIAGMLDGTFHRPSPAKLHTEKKGTLEPITTESVLVNIKKESQEEIGIEQQDFASITLAGFCEEVKPQPHHEFLFTAKSNLTSEQIKQKALNTTRARKKELKPEDIEEKFEFIDATPEAIYTLLAEVKCPLPPTHAAVFAVTAYDLIHRREGKIAADQFKVKLEKGIKENYEAMDAMVKEYYKRNPDALRQLPERLTQKVRVKVADFLAKNPNAPKEELEKLRNKEISDLPKRNPNGYAPAFLPKEQGLPEFDVSLRTAGLIK